MVINVASFGGRSHLLDTARELAKQGHIVRFYSYVPTKRAVEFGLPAECNYSLFLWALPFLALYKIFGYHNWNQYLYWRVFDVFTAYYMKPCDVFIGQSPMHNFSIRYAKKMFNALTILERGTVHVTDYNNQVKTNPIYRGKTFQPFFMMKHDIDGYNYPDYISVGSEQVAESFVKNGVQQSKLFVNNYGFDVSQFTSSCLSGEAYDLIYVGRWCYNKGCDLIEKICIKKGYRFLHVGSISDLSFPNIPNMVHIDAVEQYKLQEYYTKAKVFVIPSRCEGLAMVQLQAAACGIPIVCSKYSGGRDIKKYTISDKWIIEMDDISVKSLEECVVIALNIADTQKGVRNYLKDNFSEVSWEGYGRRYNSFLKSIVKKNQRVT